MNHKILFTFAMLAAISCCRPSPDCTKLVSLSAEAVARQVQTSGDGIVQYPYTLSREGQVKYVNLDDWRVGFFPGCLWYLKDLTGDPKWEELGRKYTEPLDSIKTFCGHHDIGFMIGSSFLLGYRMTGDESYIPVIIEAARSLSTRFRPAAGVIQSWDTNKGWQALRGWNCPVIIDNMMNLELLFEASLLSGDDSFRNIAISHADKTLENHFREDASCWHVVDYDTQTGEVRSRVTAQGYSDDSAWARGQAWALYGYTMAYRYTSDQKYLEHARKVAAFILGDANMPEDLVPYWDYDAPAIPDEPRDVSSAAVIMSALYELDTYLPGEGYRETAEKIMISLSAPEYLAAPGENGNFILKHSVGSIPHGAEVDVPLVYADYYFLEALSRRNGK